MKKSKIIITASTILLGVVGSFSTKGSNKLINNSCYITESTGHACVAYSTTCSGGTLQCHTAGGGEVLYTYPGSCSAPLNPHPCANELRLHW